MADINVIFEGEIISKIQPSNEKHDIFEGHDILIDLAKKLECDRIIIHDKDFASFNSSKNTNFYKLTIKHGESLLTTPNKSKMPTDIYDYQRRGDDANIYVSRFLKYIANDEDYKYGVKIKLNKLTNELIAIKETYNTIVAILTTGDVVHICPDDNTLIDFCMNGLKCQIKYYEHRGVIATIETGTANDGISSKATNMVDIICQNIGTLSKYASKDKIYEVFKQLK